mmetsp:Transcript_21265/g.46092  ORF Transcript_21265/g.46092 Transcript_21265/m.46092 type:complete len:84 (-) Transcript_21265:471-722(-)|eukprot:g4052.t1 g4052   contig15:241824-242249(-)
MSAIFDFSSLLTVILLIICTCAYLREMRPTIFDGGKTLQPGDTRLKRSGVTGFCWKMSRIGERLSPYVGVSCAVMAIHLLFFK